MITLDDVIEAQKIGERELLLSQMHYNSAMIMLR